MGFRDKVNHYLLLIMEIFSTSSLFHIVAWVGTLAAFIFLILMFVGLDDVLDGWFVQRIAVAFACGFGWVGVILQGEGYSTGLTLIISLFAGLALAGILLGIVVTLKRMADAPSEEIEALLGKSAEVVASPKGDVGLSVRILFQGRLQEMMAIKESVDALPVGSAVKVDRVVAPGKLYVSPLS